MKNLKLLLLLAVVSIFTFTGCEEETTEALGTNYVTFASESVSAAVDPGASSTVSIVVYTANVTSGDRTFNMNVDGSGAPAGSYTAPTSVTIPGGTNEGTIDVTINDPQNIAVNKVVFELIAEAGLSTGDATTLNFVQSCTEVTATLDFAFDGYADETGWEILDSLGGVVVSAAIGTYSRGQVSASETFTLCAGRTYTFTVVDDFGDGLSFPNNGTYTLTVGGAVKASGGGDFGASESTNFDTN